MILARSLAAAALALGLAAPVAHADAPTMTGSLTLTVSAKAERALHARGVTLRTTGRAARSGRRIRLPLAAGDRTALRTAGALRLRTRTRSVTLGAPRLELGSNPRVTALLAGRRSTVLTLAVAPVSTVNGVTLETTGAALTAVAAKTLARRLRVPRLPRASFATVAADGTFAAAAPLPAPPAPGACATTTAGGAAPDPGPGAPPVKSRPAGALAVASATVTWHVRDSFIQYIASGEGTSTGGGATAEPPTVEGGSQAPLVYGFHFSLHRWLVRSRHGRRAADLHGQRRLPLPRPRDRPARQRPRGRTRRARLARHLPDDRLRRHRRRQSPLGGARRSTSPRAAAVRVDGKTITYERIPAAVPPGAADSVFAGYYLPGDPFGWVSISFTAA